LLSRFFKVHPGYLVSDPPDYSVDLLTDMEQETDRLETWLAASTEEWNGEPEVQQFFQSLNSLDEPRRYLTLFTALSRLPLEELEVIVDAITQAHAD
jgi:hypothetical protein